MLSKSKFIIVFLFAFLLCLSPFCYSTDTNSDTALLREASEVNNIQYSDLSVLNESSYTLNNIVSGNAFISATNFSTDPTSNGGIIEGNLYVAAKDVAIKSETIYSETEYDDLGNPDITVNSYSTISGSAFIIANNVKIEPGSKIYGDLYICANNVELMRNAIIYGNVFVLSDNLSINSEIGGDLYATVDTYVMGYYGFISRDLHLKSSNSTLNGYIYRNSYISSDSIVTEDSFINQNDVTISNANDVTFSGEIMGNANINAKNITFKDKENEKDLICQIDGNLFYSAKQELNIPEGIVLGEVSYSKYSSEPILPIIWKYALNLITLLIFVYVIFFIINKISVNFISKISQVSAINLAKAFGFGIAFLIAVPLICALLFVIKVGTILGFILFIIYALIIMLASPIFIISISEFLKNKLNNKISIYLYILALTILLFLIGLIPYAGFIILLIINIIGVGTIANWNLYR